MKVGENRRKREGKSNVTLMALNEDLGLDDHPPFQLVGSQLHRCHIIKFPITPFDKGKRSISF
jgi:hypothetical protein